jgi:hypothetical protein
LASMHKIHGPYQVLHKRKEKNIAVKNVFTDI